MRLQFICILFIYTDSQLFQAGATVCHCLTSFKVKIQLDHCCIGNGNYIDVHKFISYFKGKNLLNSPEPLKQLLIVWCLSVLGPDEGNPHYRVIPWTYWSMYTVQLAQGRVYTVQLSQGRVYIAL